MKKEKLLKATSQMNDEMNVCTTTKVCVRQKKIKSKWISVFASYFMLLFCIGMVFLLASCDSESGSVTMEINPGVEYKITQKGNVSSVRFLNDDAKKALEEVSFKGQSLKTAVTFTIATYKTIGYMENNDMVLISFDKKLNENSKLKKSIYDDINQALT